MITRAFLREAPLVSLTREIAAGLYNTAADPSNYIPEKKIPAIRAAVLAACDELDGLKDGILNDPRECLWLVKTFGHAKTRGGLRQSIFRIGPRIEALNE